MFMRNFPPDRKTFGLHVPCRGFVLQIVMELLYIDIDETAKLSKDFLPDS